MRRNPCHLVSDRTHFRTQELGKDIASGSFNIQRVKSFFRDAAGNLAAACTAAKASTAQAAADDSAAWARIQVGLSSHNGERCSFIRGVSC